MDGNQWESWSFSAPINVHCGCAWERFPHQKKQDRFSRCLLSLSIADNAVFYFIQNGDIGCVSGLCDTSLVHGPGNGASRFFQMPAVVKAALTQIWTEIQSVFHLAVQIQRGIPRCIHHIQGIHHPYQLRMASCITSAAGMLTHGLMGKLFSAQNMIEQCGFSYPGRTGK